jgi:endonuclease/exonuclease/phosphatase family metal-dependent hydrolase
MDANQVLVATEISFRDKPVLVATTHLKASKTAEGEKLRAQQVDVATDLLAALRSESAAPLLFCGDWNATAEQSEHAKYASKAVPATLAHEGLRLRSVYGQAEASKTLSDTVFTTCKTRAGYTITHAIDYIFVSPDVDISAVGSLPTCEMLPAWGLPNWDWPSDHLALCAWVRFPESKL